MEIPSRKFTLFPKLPPEIRDDIWYWAIKSDNKPKVFELGNPNDVENPGSPTVADVNIAKWSCPPHPALLSVCHEANEEVRRNYQAVKFRNRTVYINFEIDWILLPNDSHFEGPDREWWAWRTALMNDGYWQMIRNIAIPASVWCHLSWTEDLVNGTTEFRWPEQMEGMPRLKRMLMAFENWAQWEDKRHRFSTKGNIEFGNLESFYVCDIGGHLPLQWIDHSKDQMKEIQRRKLWETPEVIYASVLRGVKEPLMHELMRKKWVEGQEADALLQALLEMADL